MPTLSHSQLGLLKTCLARFRPKVRSHLGVVVPVLPLSCVVNLTVSRALLRSHRNALPLPFLCVLCYTIGSALLCDRKLRGFFCVSTYPDRRNLPDRFPLADRSGSLNSCGMGLTMCQALYSQVDVHSGGFATIGLMHSLMLSFCAAESSPRSAGDRLSGTSLHSAGPEHRGTRVFFFSFASASSACFSLVQGDQARDKRSGAVLVVFEKMAVAS